MKYLLLVLLSSLFIYNSSAQQNNRFSNTDTKVSFGFKSGVNFSNMNFNKGYPAPEAEIESSWKVNPVLGLFIEVPVYKQFYIQPEYLYSMLGGEDKSKGIAYSMNYISLPVLFKYKISSTLAVLAGPQFDLLISAKQKAGGQSTTLTNDTEERSIAFDTGLEFSLLRYLSINARYIYGFNHIGIGQRSAVKEFKYDMAQLTAAIKF